MTPAGIEPATFRFVAQNPNHCATAVPQPLYKTFLILRSIQRVTSIVKPTRCTNVPNLFYFGMILYMFRTVFPSIIRSSRLYIQQQAYVKQILHQCGKFILFWNDTLHVSVFPSIIRSSRLYIQQQACVKHILLSASKQTAVSVLQMLVAVCTVLNS